jgi:hypothetical protein
MKLWDIMKKVQYHIFKHGIKVSLKLCALDMKCVFDYCV